jgi:hypothetical protein
MLQFIKKPWGEIAMALGLDAAGDARRRDAGYAA